MKREPELIALLIDPPDQDARDELIESTGAHRLMREADGRVTLEPVRSQEEFERIAKDTGCFRRGRAIRDPNTCEVIGYEMEEIGPGLMVISG